jgi:hypothetical protein
MCLPLHPFRIEREWKHRGLSCAVVQAREGMHRCGYVRVPPTHPYYGKGYDDIDARVHGGLTFAQIEPCAEHEDGQGWWFGFDFAHCGDAMLDPNPNREAMTLEGRERWEAMMKIHYDVRGRLSTMMKYERPDEHYWTQAEVEAECERFAKQLARARSRKATVSLPSS